MTTLLLTIPAPAAAPLRQRFSSSVLVCTKGHGAAAPGQVAETYFYEGDAEPRSGRQPTALDIEMISGCLARLFPVSPSIVDAYSARIFERAARFIDDHGISALLFRTGPHLPHEMALYRLALHAGLRIGMFEETSYFGRAFLFPAIERRSLGAALWSPENRFSLNADQMAAVADDSKLKEHYFGIYKARRNRPVDVARSIAIATAAVVKARISGSPLAGTADPAGNPLRPSLVGALGYWGRNIAGTLAAERHFFDNVAEADTYEALTPDDVVFYANYSPERTVFPDSYPYHDFLPALRKLSGFRRRIWREHPTQFTLPGRPYMLRGGFYKGASFYDGVQNLGWTLGPLTYPSAAVIQSPAMLACLNGTIAFESMLRRRPIIVFARTWYADLPNVSGADGRDVDLAYDPVEIVSEAFAKTLPRIDFWKMQNGDIDTVATAIDLVRGQTPTGDAD